MYNMPHMMGLSDSCRSGYNTDRIHLITYFFAGQWGPTVETHSYIVNTIWVQPSLQKFPDNTDISNLTRCHEEGLAMLKKKRKTK